MATAYFYANYLYTDDSAVTHPMRLNSLVAAAQATAAIKTSTTAPTNPISARRGPKARKKGLFARGIRLRRTAGTLPDLKVYYTTIPVLVPGDLVTMAALATITIGANAWSPGKTFGESKG